MIEQALNLIFREGSTESEFKKNWMRKKIRKSARKFGWEDELLKSLDPEWQWRLCTARLSLGALDWKGWGFRRPREGVIPFQNPIWKKAKVKKLLVMGEQGLGDEIMFSQCIPLLRDYADEIYLDCEKRLEKIFQRTFPYVQVKGRESLYDDQFKEEFDAQVFLGDLPPYFLRDRRDFRREAFLVPDPVEVERFEGFKGKIGVSWRGRQGGLDLKKYGDVSLQYGPEDHGSLEVPDLDLTNDIDGVLGLIVNLDRIVSIPTTIVHLAGGVGKKTDVILPRTGLNHGGFEEVNNALNWRWSQLHNRGKFLWHPNVTIHLNQRDYEKSCRLYK